MGIWQFIQMLLGGGGGGGGTVGSINPSTGYPIPYNPNYMTGVAPGTTTTSGGGGSSQSIIQMLTQLLTAGGGAYYGMNELQQLQRVFDQQQQNNQIAMNPKAMAARVAAATPPINRQLAYAVNQASNAGTAENGMGQSPGAVASAQASALAPFGEQNLQIGENLAEFGFPFEANQQAPNYLSVLGQLQSLGRGSTGLPGVS